MARKSKLLAALDAHKGRDYQAEKQKKLQKQAAKRKAEKAEVQQDALKRPEIHMNGANGIPELSEESEGWESDKSEEFNGLLDTSRIDDSDSESDSPIATEEPLPQPPTQKSIPKDNSSNPPPDSTSDHKTSPLPLDTDTSVASENDVPLSDLSSIASSQAEDLIPHQRLTINNLPALRSALRSISLPYPTFSFSDHQTVTATSEPHIPDINDDLTRELAFYTQSLHAATQARDLLKAEDIPFSRPTDYFAEMVKSDDHMLKIKQRLIDDASSKKASEDAKKLRDAKKFGKAVQTAKEQERAKEKRQTLEKIEAVKRKRKRNPAAGGEREDERMFDIELEEAGKEDKNRRDRRRTGGLDRDASSRGAPNKRQKKNEKFGFGGRKRFGKSGDAISSGDLRGFSVGRMKGRDDAGRGGAKGGERRIKKPQKRLGKSRRAKQGR